MWKTCMETTKFCVSPLNVNLNLSISALMLLTVCLRDGPFDVPGGGGRSLYLFEQNKISSMKF